MQWDPSHYLWNVPSLKPRETDTLNKILFMLTVSVYELTQHTVHLQLTCLHSSDEQQQQQVRKKKVLRL